jgi:O-antigen/teichoic acid export membrane protein
MLGGGIVLTKFIDSLGRLLEATVVGRRFGPSGLGMYSLAGQAAWSVVQGVNNPTGTMLYAHAIRADALEEVRLLYLRLVRVTALLTLPATMIVAALAPLLAASLLGRAWQGQAPLLLAMIFPSQALGTLCQLGGAVLYAQGRARSQVWLSLINALLRVSAVTLPFGGLPALAIGIAVANVLYAVCGLINNRIQLGWRIRDTVQVTAGPALASCAAAAAAYFVSRIAPWNLLGLVVAACAGGLVFCVVLAVIDLERLKSDWRGAAQMLRAKAA